MTDSSSGGDPRLEAFAEEFLIRRRRGESVRAEEFCERHPDLAEEIRSLFSALEVMEGLRSDWSEEEDGEKPTDSPRAFDVGGYRILREIGRGGMGVVYEAEQLSLGRRVALKVLSKSQVGEASAIQRFQREARAAARLHHTNIVPVFEVGEEGDHLYYAMQLIAGASLDRVIDELSLLRSRAAESTGSASSLMLPPEARSITRSLLRDHFRLELLEETSSGDLPESPTRGRSSTDSTGSSEDETVATGSRDYHRSVARIGLQVAQALGYSHSRGLIHRDVKPSNLIIDPAGVVWVADFGLAKESGQENMTQTGNLVGTLRYMSPERFDGRCDERADIYGLGATLYELLVLRPAITSRTRAAMIQDILHRTPPSPRSIDPRIPKDLETIVLRSMSRETDRRYASAEAMAEDLRRFIDDEPILARRISVLSRAWRWSRRNRWLAASIAFIVLLVSSATVVSIIAADHFRRQRTVAQGAQQVAETREQETLRTLYVAEMNLASAAAARGGGMEQVRDLVDHWRPERAGVDLRGWEWFYLNGRYGRESLTLRGHQGRVVSLSFSPQGDRLLSAGSDGTIHIWSVPEGRSLRQFVAHEGWVMWGDWNQAGDRIVTIGQDGLAAIWSIEPFERLLQWSISDRVMDGDWTPGRLAVIGSGPLEVFDTESGARLIRQELGQTRPQEVSVTPDGRLLALGGSGQVVQVWSVTDREPELQEVLTGYQASIEALAWDESGERLATGDSDGVVMISRRDDGSRQRMLGSHSGLVDSLAWHHDLLASASHDQTTAIWDTRSGQRLHRFEGHTRRIDTLAWSPDGRWIATGARDSTVKLWRWPPRDDDRAMIEDIGLLWSVEWSPDGRRLTVAGSRGVRIWDLGTEGEPVASPVSEEHSRDVRWSPDGSLVVGTANHDFFIRSATPGGPELLRASAMSRILEEVSFSPDGTRVVTAGGPMLKLWDPASGDLLVDFEGHTHSIRDLAWSPDGRHLATACLDGRVRIFRVDSAEPRRILTVGAEGFAIAWSRDGRWIASGWDDLTIRIHEVETGRELGILRGHRGVVRELAWSPDGERLASCADDRSVRLWNPETFEQTLALEEHVAPVRSVDWSPDGRRLASVDDKGRIQIWDATVGYRSNGRAKGD